MTNYSRTSEKLNAKHLGQGADLCAWFVVMTRPAGDIETPASEVVDI